MKLPVPRLRSTSGRQQSKARPLISGNRAGVDAPLPCPAPDTMRGPYVGCLLCASERTVASVSFGVCELERKFSTQAPLVPRAAERGIAPRDLPL